MQASGMAVSDGYDACLAASSSNSLTGNAQDPTSHPAWTGETKVELQDDSHAARFMKKFGMTKEDLQASTSDRKD